MRPEVVARRDDQRIWHFWSFWSKNNFGPSQLFWLHCKTTHTGFWLGDPSMCNNNNLYYNYKFKVLIRRRRQKKYEILANMKNAPYTWQKKYENLVEPSRTSQARFSYFFSVLVRNCQIFILYYLPLKICQICMLFLSPCQNLPDCHTFSIFSKFCRLALVNWAKLK